VGSLVNKSIEEFGDELRQEKEKLRNEFFDPDE
jgi:predicted HTH domain antitoxin